VSFLQRYSFPSVCTTVTDPKQHTDQDRLCFNCLGHHKISSCNSKHHCHYCCRKHYTSLCSLRQQNSHTDNPPTTPVNPVQQQSNGTTCHSLPVQTHGGHPTSSVQHQTASQLQPANPHQTATQPTVQSTGVHSVTLPPKCNNFCLLKTAVARVKGPNRNAEANILLMKDPNVHLLPKNWLTF